MFYETSSPVHFVMYCICSGEFILKCISFQIRIIKSPCLNYIEIISETLSIYREITHLLTSETSGILSISSLEQFIRSPTIMSEMYTWYPYWTDVVSQVINKEPVIWDKCKNNTTKNTTYCFFSYDRTVFV